MQDLNDKVTGNSLTAAEWNQVPSEIQNVIEGLGQTLSSGDLNQLGKGIAGYAANGQFYIDSGAADAYVLSQVGSKQGIPAYAIGARFIFVPSNANTGASTANVSGLGVKNIKTRDGRDPAAGVIPGNLAVILEYDGTNLVLLGTVAIDASAEILPFTFASDANDTLTDGENQYSRIVISGSTLTAARTLTVGGVPRRLSVSNGEGFSVTVQGSSGVSVPAGESLELYYDGTNVVIPENAIGNGSSTVPKSTVIAGSAKAWVNFNGTGTVAIDDSFNVVSITDNGTGNYTVNFTNSMPSASYCAVCGTNSAENIVGTYQASSVVVLTQGSGGAASDVTEISVAVFSN